jgi:hypothetical protein
MCHQRRLADAGFAVDDDGTASTRRQVLDHVVDQLDLGPPPEERTLA